jgi:polar amino acid transport system substrate-binding protein
MKLAPVAQWFVRDRDWLKVVETGITRERLGVCVRKGDTVLRGAIGNAQAVLIRNGTLPALIGQWLGAGASAAP